MFYFDDPTDDSRADAPVGAGNGVNTVFTLYRAFGIGGFQEPVGGINQLLEVYFNGVQQHPSVYGKLGNQINFATPPPNGTVITADFTFWYLCRFLEDQHDYEMFMYNLWQLKTCKFRSVKSSD